MAGTIVHLAVADAVLQRLGDGVITSPALWYTGAFAPDAIHARENYVRPMKKHTHLMEDISIYDFHDGAKVSLFHERLRDYAHTYYRPDEPDRDLILGYIVHLLTDEAFNTRLRPKFVKAMAYMNLSVHDKAYGREMMADVDRIDFALLRRYPFRCDIRAMLEGVWGIGVPDMLTAEEVDRSKRWVMTHFFDTPHPDDPPRYCTYEEIEEFIGETSAYIAEKLVKSDAFC